MKNAIQNLIEDLKKRASSALQVKTDSSLKTNRARGDAAANAYAITIGELEGILRRHDRRDRRRKLTGANVVYGRQ